MCIDGALHPLHLALSEHWKVHYFTAGMKDHAERQAEEAEFLEHMPRVLGAQAMAGLGHIHDALGLDYCGFDFRLHEDGRIMLYEANATMLINPPGPEAQWDYRRPAISAALSAAQQLVASRSRICSTSTATTPA
jgi:hypothetical protein